MLVRKLILAGASAAAMSFAIPAAIAQEAAPAEQPQSQAQPTEQPTDQAPAGAATMDDSKLESFAVAFLQVNEIARQYQPQLESAASEEDRQKIQQEAGEKMIEAVEASEGISVTEYNEIIQAAQTDPDLAQRINGHLTGAAQ